MSAPNRHYVPGHRLPKALMVLAGCAVMILGAAELAGPARLIWHGTTTVGEVVKVVRTAPGEPEQVFTHPGTIEQDRNPRAIFWPHVEYQSEDGANHIATLTSASSWRPAYRVGEQMQIAVDPDQPELAVPIYDLRTWVFGGVFAGLGTFMIFLFGVLLHRAGRPIPVPEDTPPEAAL